MSGTCGRSCWPTSIRRTAEHAGLRVQLVQNITDVGHMADDSDLEVEGEDKILEQAQAEGRGPLDIARHYEAAFHRDLARMNVRPATAYPRASDSIDLMLDLVAVWWSAATPTSAGTGRSSSTRGPSPATAS